MAKKAATSPGKAGEAPSSRTTKGVASDVVDMSMKREPVASREAASAKKAAATLLTLTDISDHLAKTFDMPKSHAKIYLSETVALIAKNLRKGNKVRITGLGIFQVKKRAARKGHNPGTGEPMKIKASKRVGFTVSRDLKSKL